MSRALDNPNPFSDAILKLNTAQMNFILRMYAEDHPEDYTILDPDIIDGQSKPQVWSAWTHVLRGKALEEFFKNPVTYIEKAQQVKK